MRKVSIQPKPEKGLEDIFKNIFIHYRESFNPAEAREGFRRKEEIHNYLIDIVVSIQPKPEKGLEEEMESAL